MALRKILFQNASEGFFEEFDPAGGTHQLDANGGFINNVAGPPTLGHQVTNKDYVDAVASGLDLKASCRVKTVADMADAAVKATLDFTGKGTLANLTTVVEAVANGLPGNLLKITVVNDDGSGVTVNEAAPLITIHYKAGLSTEDDIEDAIAAQATLITVKTAHGGAVAVTGGCANQFLTGGVDGWTYTGTPTFTLQASSSSSLNNTIDGVTLVAGTLATGDRVLVTMRGGADITPDTNNGIYVVTTLGDDASAKFTLTRANDFDASVEITAGAFTFVTEGTATADKGFVLVTNDPITLDTTPLAWSQFSSTTVYSFNQGLTESSGAVKVDLDTAAAAQTVGAGGGSSGLEFDVDTASGKLRVAVSAAGGLSRAADGIKVLIDPKANTAGNQPNLYESSTGLKVLYGPKVQDNYIANEAIGTKNAVCWAAGVSDKLCKARADSDAKAHVIGVALTAAANQNETMAIVSEGPCPGALTSLGFVANDPVYLGDTGGLVNFATVGGAKRVVLVGYAMNTADLFVDIRDLGKKASA